MVAIKNLFFLITAASALVLPRADYQTVLTDLQNTDSDTNTLTGLVNAYTGTGAQTLKLRQQITKVKNDIDTAANDANASPTPTAAQAQTVLDYINNTLYPDTQTALTATKNKRATFTSNGLKAEVLQDLKDLKASTDNLADKLIAKAPTAALVSAGQTSKANFDSAFNDAITYFS